MAVSSDLVTIKMPVQILGRRAGQRREVQLLCLTVIQIEGNLFIRDVIAGADEFDDISIGIH